MKYVIRRGISVLLICCLILISGCGVSPEKTSQADLLDNKSEKHEKETVAEQQSMPEIEKVEGFYLTGESGKDSNLYSNPNADKAIAVYNNFAVRTFQNAISSGNNELISPLSFYYAMAILANGANGYTRDHMESVLGMTVEDLNQFLYELDKAPKGYGDDVINKANAICFNTDLGSLGQEYKDTVEKYYGDSIFEGSFADTQQLVTDVNQWSSEKTDGGINDIVDESDIKKDTVILILNALTAGGKWDLPFNPADTRLEAFSAYNGQNRMTEMMHQTLFGYWETADSKGFMKEIENGVCFVGILPNEGIDIYEYIESMDGDTIQELLDSYYTEDYVETKRVSTPYGSYETDVVDEHYTVLSFPKFTYDTEYDLKEVLVKLGLSDLLDTSTCDFSRIDSDVYVQAASQKATVEVDEEKATAAAVSVMIGGKGSGGPEVRNTYYHEVKFDRPFVYAFISRDPTLQLFIGSVVDVGEDIEEGAFQIENIAGTINIRSIPSTKGDVIGKYELGQKVFAFEKTSAEGYTWYRIGDGQWVADQNGEWISIVE